MASTHKERNVNEILSLEALEGSSSLNTMSPTAVTLREETSMVTLQQNEDDTLILCPVSDSSNGHGTSHSIPSDATFTYATLDVGGNFVLNPIKTGQHTQVPQTGFTEVASAHNHHTEKESDDSQVTNLVGEGVDGDTMAYIYIKGEGEVEVKQTDVDRENAHTITLNSADGTTLHTLPASYTQHLEHTYGNLVLVNSSNEASTANDIGRPSTNNAETSSGEASQHTDSVFLFSVQPIKLENQEPLSTLSLPPPSQESAPQRDSNSSKEMLLENEITTDRTMEQDVLYLEKLPKEEVSAIEERLATRDSLLPPKKQRRLKVYVCPICQACFKLNYLYNTHIATHEGSDIWVCDICNFSCDTAAELKQHKKSMHKDDRPYKCPQCELRFQKNQLLENHVRFVHNKERPLSCKFCKKGFYRPHDLKMHLNLHLGIKSNVCHVCGRQFSHPSNLIRHQRLHTGIKPYVCPICGKRFFQLVLLHKHRATHLPGAGVCPHCPSTFRSAAGLKKHCKFVHKKSMTLQEASNIMRGHGETTGRRYYCQVCGDKFLLKCDLKKHEQKEHGNGDEILCPSCNKVFTAATAKSHICISVEEEEKRNRLSGDDPDEPRPVITTDSLRKIKNENFLEPEKNIKVEEEYLVMYITPEGESVSYMTKKMEEGNKVLQINAPIGDHLPEDSLQRPALPEETIMINVHDRPLINHQQSDPSLISLSAAVSENDCLSPTQTDRKNSLSVNSGNLKKPPLSLVKLEPTVFDNDAECSPVSEDENSQIPVSGVNKTGLRKSLRAVAVKRERKMLVRNKKSSEEMKNENELSVSNVFHLNKSKERNKVLQMNAPIGGHLPSDSLQKSVLPEGTIMINVHDRPLMHHQQGDASPFSFSSSLPEDNLNSANLSDLKKPSLSFVKLEPSMFDYDADSSLANEDENLPISASGVKNESKKSFLRPVALKRDVKPIVKSRKSPDEIKKESELSPPTVPPLTCKFCGKTFKKRWNLEQHSATHDASLHRYVCEICSLTFAYRSTYTSHLKKHSNDDSVYECELCKKTYKKKVALSQHHRRDHLKIRPYSCEECGKQFYSKGDYKYHMRVHNKEKPYICFACGRGFNHRSHLHRHERMHTDERPHKCPFCPKEFIQLVTLKIHLKKHEKLIARDESLGQESMYQDANVDMNLALGRDLPEDASQIIVSVADGINDAAGSSLIVINDSADAIHDTLRDPSSADVRLGQGLVGGNPAVEGGAGLSGESLNPGGMFPAPSESDESCAPHQLITSDPSIVVTGMDSDCIAIFVRENLN